MLFWLADPWVNHSNLVKEGPAYFKSSPTVSCKDYISSNNIDSEGDQQIPVFDKQNFMAPFIFNSLCQLE